AGQVLEQVQALPEAQRSTVFLAYVEGLSYREVAAVLDIPVGTVMSRLATARAKLAGGMELPDRARTSNGGGEGASETTKPFPRTRCGSPISTASWRQTTAMPSKR